jgi:hypothetical protein
MKPLFDYLVTRIDSITDHVYATDYGIDESTTLIHFVDRNLEGLVKTYVINNLICYEPGVSFSFDEYKNHYHNLGYIVDSDGSLSKDEF